MGFNKEVLPKLVERANRELETFLRADIDAAVLAGYWKVAVCLWPSGWRGVAAVLNPDEYGREDVEQYVSVGPRYRLHAEVNDTSANVYVIKEEVVPGSTPGAPGPPGTPGPELPPNA